jgi:endonuclease YncB( thermonuclease family)
VKQFLTIAVALPLLAPDTVSGVATAIDGDTIRVGQHMAIHVRIQGIAAPETYQPGGKDAQARMHTLVDGKVVTCTIPFAAETHDRMVGACSVDGADIGGIMTSDGLARDCWAYLMAAIRRRRPRQRDSCSCRAIATRRGGSEG